MCGIFGKLNFAGGVPDQASLERMGETFRYRGPDDKGLHIAPHIGLGQARLAIIDLDHRSTAPLSNEDGSIWVTLNGEIYNYRELRQELREKGHQFRSEGDTEVLV